MRSLMTKMRLLLGVYTLTICVGLGMMGFVFGIKGQKDTYERDMEYIAQQSAECVESKVQGRISTLTSIAGREDMKSTSVDSADKAILLGAEIENVACLRMNFIDTEGNLYGNEGDSYNVSERGYFKQAITGETYVSDPIISQNDGSIVMIYAVPVMDDGEVSGIITAAVDGSELTQFVNAQTFGSTGYGFILNESGTYIAHNTIELVNEEYNVFENEEEIDEFEEIISTTVSTVRLSGDGTKRVVAHAPVESMNWYVGISITQDEVYEQMNTLFFNILISIFVFMIIGTCFAYLFARKIAGRVTNMAEHMKVIATGDFSNSLSYKVHGKKDEIDLMSNSIDEMQQNVGGMLTTIKDTSVDLSSSSEQLKNSSEEIEKLSGFIADAIAEIAEGTGMQSGELVKINMLIAEFGNQLSHMSEQTFIVDESSRRIDAMAARSSVEMNELEKSVAEVSTTFSSFEEGINKLGTHIQEINSITTMITSVANQTNLLALNASIEAARAGEAGKGFAVVAEEIKNLAEQSKDSSETITQLIGGVAKDTKALVEESYIVKEELGGQMGTIRSSIESFSKIVEEVNEILPKIQELKSSAEVIEQNKNLILGKVDELSSVSEEISASTEEITASTEEMNSSIVSVAEEANELNHITIDIKEQVSKFTV